MLKRGREKRGRNKKEKCEGEKKKLNETKNQQNKTKQNKYNNGKKQNALLLYQRNRILKLILILNQIKLWHSLLNYMNE
jgi:hypothetical protein